MLKNRVPLVQYHGKWLTDAEILLSKFFEAKHEERANESRAKQIERELLAQKSRSLQPVSTNEESS